MSVIALDPGNSTGWVARVSTGELVGGTIVENHNEVYKLLEAYRPEVIVYETFQMYPGKAQKLIWNTFYPCEVIGVIKLYVQRATEIGEPQFVEGHPKLVGLQPSVKKFAFGPEEADGWKKVDRFGQPATEHLRDAYRLLRYYERYLRDK